MAAPSWIRNELDLQKATYRLSRHEPAPNASVAAQREHVSDLRFGKVVVGIADGEPVLFVLPAFAVLDIGLARLSIGAQALRLATPAEIAARFPETDIEAIPPLPHWSGVAIWADQTLRQDSEVLFQAGTREDVVAIEFADWMRIAKPRIAMLARPSFIGA